MALVTVGLVGTEALSTGDDGFTGSIAAGPVGVPASQAAAQVPAGTATPTLTSGDAGSRLAIVPLPQGALDVVGWGELAAPFIDDVTLAGGAVTLPYGANVLAARIFGGGPSPAYAFYEAGGGAFSNQFYVASSIKLLAALGALSYVKSLGFSGEATVDGEYTIHEIYDSAIRNSDNDDYSRLVRIAGVEWLNHQFLPAEGFELTAIQEAYGGGDEQVAYSPPMTLREGDRSLEVEARSGYDDYGCGGSNCTDLFDLVNAVRRVVLDDEIPAAERFPIAASDISGLKDALLGAPSWLEPGVHAALPNALIYSKPGWVGGLDCVDAALIDDPPSGQRYLIALSVPDDGDECAGLASMAYDIITTLAGRDDGLALRSDGTTVSILNGRQAAAPGAR